MRIADAGIAWTGLYVASKVAFALRERLGVTGGPEVSPAGYLAYGPGEVAAAQWANAGSGVLIMAILLAGRIRTWGRWPYRIVLVAHVLCAAVATVGAAGMLGGAVLTDRGGAPFGLYCAVWAVLLFLATRDLRARQRHVGGAGHVSRRLRR